MFEIFRDTDPLRPELYVRRVDGSRFITEEGGTVLGLSSVAEARQLVDTLVEETIKITFLGSDDDAES